MNGYLKSGLWREQEHCYSRNKSKVLGEQMECLVDITCIELNFKLVGVNWKWLVFFLRYWISFKQQCLYPSRCGCILFIQSPRYSFWSCHILLGRNVWLFYSFEKRLFIHSFLCICTATMKWEKSFLLFAVQIWSIFLAAVGSKICWTLIQE